MKFLLPGTVLLLGHLKGVVDGIGGEAKVVCPQVLSKMENVIVQNALDFEEVCKANLHCGTTHLMAKEQQKKLKKLDLWSVSPKVKGIPKAVMNTGAQNLE